jgi:Tfp pilus assembly protein PilN
MTAHQDEDTQILTATLESTYTVPRVNLLPPEIIETRRFRRTQGILGGCVVGVLVAVGGVFLLAQGRANEAAEELAVARAETTRLAAEEATYAEVPRVMAQVDAAETARDQALATNVAWYRFLNDLARTYPEEVWLENLTATVAAPGGTTGAVPAPVAGSNPLATPGIGTVTFTGTALAHSDVASWLDVLARTEGFADASFTNSARTQIDGQDVVSFTSQVVVTADALWDRYENEAR